MKKPTIADNDTSAPVEEAPGLNSPPRISLLDLMSIMTDTISNVDQGTAISRVAELREQHPEASVDDLVDTLIKQKCQQTGVVGAATSGAALIPGVGTLASLTVGLAADISIAFRLQSELVIEIAAAHRRLLTEEEKQRAILIVTGLSAGANQLVARTGRKVSVKIEERFTQKWLFKLMPFIGIAASAGTNVLSTYIIGRRAHDYFGLGPDEMKDWHESLRAISGIDVRKIRRLVAGSGLVVGGRAAARNASSTAVRAANSLVAAGASTRKGAGAVARATGRISGPISKGLTQKKRDE